MPLARKVRLVGMDVDGVLTAGEIIVLDSNEEVKIWDVKDRFAMHLARRSGAGLSFVWITGRTSKQVSARAKEMRIDVVRQNCMEKREALAAAARKFGLSPEAVAFIGDDLVDIPPLRYAGLAVCPADAPYEVKREADFVSSSPGGRGVLREVVEIILKAQGRWEQSTDGYL